MIRVLGGSKPVRPWLPVSVQHRARTFRAEDHLTSIPSRQDLVLQKQGNQGHDVAGV